MSFALLLAIVVLPLITAVVVAMLPSWRTGLLVNAASTSLGFLLGCAVPFYLGAPRALLHAGPVEAHLVLLTSFIVMTTAWFNIRHVRELLATQTHRLDVRLHHVAFQVLHGAILLAVLSDDPMLTWFALAVAVAAAVLPTGATRATTSLVPWLPLQSSGVGLMLALTGTLLLFLTASASRSDIGWSALSATASHDLAQELAGIFLVLGYGALAGLVPLHLWLVNVAATGFAPNAIVQMALLVNVPLLVMFRIRTIGMVPDLLLALGLATLLVAGGCTVLRSEVRRSVALLGMAMTGIIVFAFGLGAPAATLAALLLMTLLALARSAALQVQDLSSSTTSLVCMLALAGSPLLALFLIAGATAERSPWLLPPLAVGVLLSTWTFVARLPVRTEPAVPHVGRAATSVLAPIWLQLALVLILAIAMPGVVRDWFGLMLPAAR